MAGGLLRPAGGIGGGVPEGAPVVLERVELITHLLQAGAHVGEGERRPVGEVPFGRRAVPGEVAQGELGQRLGPLEPARCRHPLAHQRVGVLAVDDASAADQPAQLGVGQQDHQHLPAARDTALAQLVGQLRAGELSSARQCLRDGGDGVLDRALVEAVGGRSCWPVTRRTRGPVRSSSQPMSSARTKCHVGRSTCVRTTAPSSSRVARSAWSGVGVREATAQAAWLGFSAWTASSEPTASHAEDRRRARPGAGCATASEQCRGPAAACRHPAGPEPEQTRRRRIRAARWCQPSPGWQHR